MNNTRTSGDAVLLTVCFLSQLVIGTAQPWGLSAGVLLPILALGTLTQGLLFRLLGTRRLPQGTAYSWALALLLCFAAGYDVVRADRFYRAVTSQSFSFWWLAGCMLLLGLYASSCGRGAVQRIALPVLAGLAVSLAVLLTAGSPSLQNLPFPQFADISWPQAARVYLQYTFGAELLLWVCWQGSRKYVQTKEGGGAGQGAAKQKPQPGGWQVAIWVRFAVAAVFIVLGQMVLGQRFADTPQLFGVLSLVASGSDAAHSGVLWHCIWLGALAVRVCAICCTLAGLLAGLLPRMATRRRGLLLCGVLLAATLLWAAFWRQDCLTVLAAAVTVLTAAAILFRRKGEGHAQ